MKIPLWAPAARDLKVMGRASNIALWLFLVGLLAQPTSTSKK